VLLEFSRQIFRKKGAAARHHRTMISPGGKIHRRARNSTDEELAALPIWAFTLGVFALLTFGLTAVPSVICGHVALSRGRNHSRSSLSRSVAAVGLVIGYVGVAILGTWLIVAVRYLAS
jgi:hypothetical protein